MTTHWYRLSLDLDPAGNPIGSSYEVHVGERITAIHVLPQPGPFDTIEEVVQGVREDLEGRYGVAVTLPGL